MTASVVTVQVNLGNYMHSDLAKNNGKEMMLIDCSDVYANVLFMKRNVCWSMLSLGYRPGQSISIWGNFTTVLSAQMLAAC